MGNYCSGPIREDFRSLSNSDVYCDGNIASNPSLHLFEGERIDMTKNINYEGHTLGNETEPDESNLKLKNQNKNWVLRHQDLSN